MRVAVVHNFYRSDQPSGENIVVEAQLRALSRAGHEVLLVARSSDDLEGRMDVLGNVVRNVIVGRGRQPGTVLRALHPAAVLTHNLFPRWPDAWLGTTDVPVIRFLHNYRAVCAAGTLVRDGALCTRCPDGSTVHAVQHACYRGSRLQTVPLAISGRSQGQRHRREGGPHFVVHSDRAKGLFRSFGWQESQLTVIPNFCPAPPRTGESGERRGWCVVGRLTREKGIVELVTSWEGPEVLTVLGDGPLMPEVRRAAEGRAVRLLGHADGPGVAAVLAKSRGHVFPSLSPEGAIPLVYMEALAQGTPTIAVRGNGAADHIERNFTGQVVASARDVPASATALRWSEGDRARAAAVYQREFTEGVWVHRIERLIARLGAMKDDVGVQT